MLGFIGDHYIYLPIAGGLIFMVVMIALSIEEGLRRPH